MTREYRSDVRERRASANRGAVLAAATRMFVANGWTGTTMASVADAAGLTRQTVYQQFQGKLELLDACIVAGLTGPGDVAIRDQPGYRAMMRGDLATRVSAAARWLRRAHERGAAIQDVLDQAAVTDEDAAARLARREAARWAEVAHASTLLTGARPPDDVIDSMWTLASRRCWLLLVRDRGWDGDRWERWFTSMALTTLG